jgi:fructosamine-3-kinase
MDEALERTRRELRELRELARKVLAELEDDPPHGPGHAHDQPGIWDADNEPGVAGQPCAWCATWARFKALAQRRD